MVQGISEQVKTFYEDLPFNFYESANNALRGIRDNPIKYYPDLDELLRSKKVKTVLDAGCGAGWFSNACAYHYNKKVIGVDFSSRALERARQVAKELGTADTTQFIHSDLFELQGIDEVDLLVSIGVLHHTKDARGCFDYLQRFVATPGYCYIGLYHYYGRKVFLEMFKQIVEEQGEDTALGIYQKMHTQLDDRTHAQSWFRDQVLHPHESLHTLKEVHGWLTAAEYRLNSTSINRFKKFNSVAKLIEQERDYEKISYQANIVERRYFPGFFMVLGQKA